MTVESSSAICCSSLLRRDSRLQTRSRRCVLARCPLTPCVQTSRLARSRHRARCAYAADFPLNLDGILLIWCSARRIAEPDVKGFDVDSADADGVRLRGTPENRSYEGPIKRGVEAHERRLGVTWLRPDPVAEGRAWRSLGGSPVFWNCSNGRPTTWIAAGHNSLIGWTST